MERNPKRFREHARRVFGKEAATLVLAADDLASQRAGSRTKQHRDVAELLLHQRADQVVVAAALLSPLRRERRVERAEIEALLGPAVADLVEQAVEVGPLRGDTAQHHHEDLRRLMDSLSGDMRVVILRLGLRVNDLKGGETPGCAAHRDLAQESLDLYVPLADRLGMSVLCAELQDQCFRILEPAVYDQLARAMGVIRSADEACVDSLSNGLAQLLRRHGITARVHGRVKSLYSLYSKMLRRQCSLQEITDRIGLRVIVSSETQCYAALQLLHTHFCPIPGTFDDYIASPKANGYQSLHTCIYAAPDAPAQPVEIQIRTRAMDQEAEFGVAAHWRYKNAAEAKARTDGQLAWLRGLNEMCQQTINPTQFIMQVRTQVYGDEIPACDARSAMQTRKEEGALLLDGESEGCAAQAGDSCTKGGSLAA